MSYCQHCNKSVNALEKKKLSKQIAKGALNATTQVADFANKAHDDAAFHNDEQRFEKGEITLGELYRSDYERSDLTNMAENIGMSANHKVVDATMGSDTYFSCGECSLEIDFPQANSRPEYLGLRYDAGSALSKKVFGILTLMISFSILRSFMGIGAKTSFIAFAIGAVGYFSVGFVPLKPRGILNLLSENIKVLIGAVFASGIIIMLGGLGISAIIPKGIVQNIVFIVWMLAVGVGLVYTMINLNKTRWNEIKETWFLLDEFENSSPSETHTQPEKKDKNAA
jgi:hypothetical protein